MLKLVINADDLGMSEIVNQEILKMIKLGAISSSSILANGVAFDKVKDIVENSPKISFGVHLNLDEFESLTHSVVLEEYGIINKDGFFLKGAIFKIVHFDKKLEVAIKEELFSQIKKVSDLGIHISHIDSHHHIHTIVGLFDIIQEVSKSFNIHKCRLSYYPSFRIIYLQKKNQSKNRLANSVMSSTSKRKSYFNKTISFTKGYLKHKYFCFKVKSNFRTTNDFFSYKIFFDYLKLIYGKNNNVIIELMCHPGHKLYNHESELVLQKALKSKIEYELISYHKI